MRFKKGTKVEVLTKSAVPSGAWRSAEIISGNGHYYTVMYDADDSTERVPRKSMRPEPPPHPPQAVHSWSPGDVLEVFQSCSWKMAIVSKVLENDCVLVRLLGSSINVKANKSDVRVRQSWQDNEWIMVGQGSSESKDKVNESDVLGPKKRTYSLVTPHNQTTQVEEEEDRESIASSVGSCSRDMDGLITVSFGPIETGHSSDTESSSCGYRSIKTTKSSFTAKGSEAVDVHKLELDEYRCSIERLHASGPIITWEQETWITNLRLRLNISNEEHLLQIRNLISEDNSSAYR